MDKRVIFSPVYSAWNKLSIQYKTPVVINSKSSWARVVAPIANVAKKGMIALACVVCTIAMAVFSLLVLPYRLYQWPKIQTESLKADQDRLKPGEYDELSTEIRSWIDTKEAKGKFTVSPFEKDQIIHEAVCQYARSREVYGPVVVAWVDHLLEKANNSKSKLVFLARDGIAPYKMVLEMMENPVYQKKYPHLKGKDQIVLAYFSRSVIKNAEVSDEERAIFRDYSKQIGIQNGDRCILVDIGFAGSMIAPIKEMLPEVTLSFNYLISHTPNAEGFIYSHDDERILEDSVLSTIQSISYRGAGSNFAVHWLEDSHQGVLESPKRLVKVDDNVYPETMIPGKKMYTTPKGSHDYILRKWSCKAIQRSLKNHPPETILKQDVVGKLDDTLKKINNQKFFLLIKHT